MTALRVLARFRNIKESGIADSLPQLNNMIQKEGFPEGFLLSPRVRVWDVAEINAWLDTRSTKTTEPPKGIIRLQDERKKRRVA